MEILLILVIIGCKLGGTVSLLRFIQNTLSNSIKTKEHAGGWIKKYCNGAVEGIESRRSDIPKSMGGVMGVIARMTAKSNIDVRAIYEESNATKRDDEIPGGAMRNDMTQ